MKKALKTTPAPNAFNSLIESKDTVLSRINQMFSDEINAISLMIQKLNAL